MAGGRAGDLDGPKGTEIKRLWGQAVPLREVVAVRPKDRVVGEGLGPSSGQDSAGEAGVGCRLRCPQPQRRRGRRPRPRLVANGRHARGVCPRHH